MIYYIPSPVPRIGRTTCAPSCVKQLQKASKRAAHAYECIISLILFCDMIFFPIPLTSDTKNGSEEWPRKWHEMARKQDWRQKKKIWKTDKILSISSSPEEYAQDVGYEQHQADSGGEALTVVTLLDLLVLWHIGQGPSKHHDEGRQPGKQRPRALHVLIL